MTGWTRRHLNAHGGILIDMHPRRPLFFFSCVLTIFHRNWSNKIKRVIEQMWRRLTFNYLSLYFHIYKYIPTTFFMMMMIKVE